MLLSSYLFSLLDYKLCFICDFYIILPDIGSWNTNVGKPPFAGMLRESVVLIQWILWTLEVFTCKYFGSRLFDYVSFFNAHELWVKRVFLSWCTGLLEKGQGMSLVSSLSSSLLYLSVMTPNSWRAEPCPNHACSSPTS